MVDWTTWVSVVFEVVDEAGLDVDSGVFTDTTRAASVIWQEDKVEIKAMSRREAKAFAEAELEIST